MDASAAAALSAVAQHKRIPGTRIVVDGFRHAHAAAAGTASGLVYFLSHFHSDHYEGISDTWQRGPIYCSAITAKLLARNLGVRPEFIHALPLDEGVDVDGVGVTLVDANHCPGAVQFIFKVPEGDRIVTHVHCGDMRYSPAMKENKHLAQCAGQVDDLFLDTTYCNPKYVFPPQSVSVEYVAEVIHRTMQEIPDEKTLFLIATYVIGKEKILSAVAERCGCLVHVDQKKLSTLECLQLPNMHVFTTDSAATPVHVVSWNYLGEAWPYFRPNWTEMEKYMAQHGYDKAVGFVPTGWTYEMKRKAFATREKGNCFLHLVPYSEHSNYDELREYVAFLRPARIIPTVGVEGMPGEDKASANQLKYFTALIDQTASKQRFLRSFGASTSIAADNSNSKGGVADDDDDGAGDDNNEEPMTSGRSPVASSTVVAPTTIQPSVTPKQQQQTKPTLRLRDTAPKLKGLLAMETEADDNDDDDVATNINASCAGDGKNSSQTQQEENGEKGVKPVVDEKLQQLQAILPMGVSIAEVKSLLKRSNADVATAVAMFYDKATTNVKPTTTTTPEKRPRKSLANNNSNNSAKKARSTDASKGQAKISQFFGTKGKPQAQTESKTESKSPHDDACERLKAIVPVADKDEVTLLLTQARGDVQRAADMYYTNQQRVLEVPTNAPNNSGTGDDVDAGRSVMCEDNREVDMAAPASEEERVIGKEHVVGKVVTPTLDVVDANVVTLPLDKYDPVAHACWKEVEAAPYLHLSRAFEAIEQIRGRLKISDILTNMFRSLLALSPDDVLPAVYLTINKVAPDFESHELNIGGSTVAAAISEATGVARARLRELYVEKGDLGDVAQACRQTQRMLMSPPPLRIRQVYKAVRQISKESGSGSAERKKAIVLQLLRACREREPQYVVRTLVQHLRIGAVLKSVLPALARAAVMHQHGGGAPISPSSLQMEIQSASLALTEAYSLCPNLDILVPMLVKQGPQAISETAVLTAGMCKRTPIKPMLAKITSGIPEVLKQFANSAFTCEYKYDGQRAQIHLLPNAQVKVFSRNLSDTSARFPDVADIVRTAAAGGASSLIIDAELVAVDRTNNNNLLSFQELSTRSRVAVTLSEIKVSVCVFVFDVLAVNGSPLVRESLRSRRDTFDKAFPNRREGYLEFAHQMTVEGDVAPDEASDKVEAFLHKALGSRCEGIMCKALDEESSYEPSKRSDRWLKVKRDYVSGLHDTLDLVPIGAWWGNGRKAGWFSPFLVAVWDPDKEEYQSLCRVMSGFSDAFYQKVLHSITRSDCSTGLVLTTALTRSVTCGYRPTKCGKYAAQAKLTLSPVHKAAVGWLHESRGLGLRFPRFVGVREDKGPDNATGPDVVVEMYKKQKHGGGAGAPANGHVGDGGEEGRGLDEGYEAGDWKDEGEVGYASDGEEHAADDEAGDEPRLDEI
eukprot:jgi/Chlat1/5825/Chrsp4S06177